MRRRVRTLARWRVTTLARWQVTTLARWQVTTLARWRVTTLARAAGTMLLTACASGGAGEPPKPAGPAGNAERTRTAGAAEGSNLDMSYRSTNFVSSNLVAATLDSAWAVLPEIWKSLGITTIDGISTKDRRLQTGQMRLHRQLGGVALSRYIECGRTTQGLSADIYFIVMRLETVLTGNDGAVLVQSAMAVTGEGTGNSGQVTRCSTSGELERRIAERLATRLQK